LFNDSINNKSNSLTLKFLKSPRCFNCRPS
jgi:hypothetical protein